MQKAQIQALEPTKIVAAFEIIINASNSKEVIKEADNYIRMCESNPEFAETLMMIFDKVNNTQKWQILIHLNNVIKRNWTTKRRVNQSSISEERKQNIKNGMLELYKAHWEIYYKQFNQIFKFLSKYEFPANYESLKNFLLQILSTLANSDIEILIAPKQLLPYLSLVKAVFKQNSKRLSHSKQSYLEHIAEPVRLASIIFTKINNALAMIKSIKEEGLNENMSNKTLECSRKIDKIILYCLQSSVSSMQTDSFIKEIIYNLVMKVELLLGLRCKPLNDQIQLDLFAILEGLSKIQMSFPFYFAGFLQKYLKVILNLLIGETFKNEDLTKCIITSNSKPLTTVVYFLNQTQFLQSIQCKKGSGLTFVEQQRSCHADFIHIYGGSNATAFMEKAILELMEKYTSRQDQGIMFEDSQYQDASGQYSCFQLLMTLLKNLMLRFKDEFKAFNQKIINHLIQNKLPSTASKVAYHMYEVIILLPKVFDEPNLKIDKVFQLMQICFAQNDYGMFSRLIRSYNSYCNTAMICKSFQILVSIISNPNTNHQILYQCAVCIKKILSEHDEEGLPVENLGFCLGNLLKLASLYKETPSHLWSLLQLINEILKMVSNQATIKNLQCIVENLRYLSGQKDNDEVVVTAIADLLQNIMETISAQVVSNYDLLQYLFQISINLVGVNICNPKIENTLPLLRLWLSVTRNVHVSKCSRDFTEKLFNAIHAMKNKIMAEDPVIFLELMEEYMLAGLLNLNADNVLSLSDQILSKLSFEERPRTLMALFSFYFTYYLLTKNFIPKFLILAMEEIINMKNTLSQNLNILRTFLILIINHHIIQIGFETIFQLLNEHYQNNYKTWLDPYLWSLEYLNYKYSCKVASLAMLRSLGLLQKTAILFESVDQWNPLLTLMKTISFQVEPVNLLSALTSYSNSFKTMLKKDERSSKSRLFQLKGAPRKFKLHIKQEWAEFDLSNMYREQFGRILESMGWTVQTISDKFDKMASTRILRLLIYQQEPSNT